MRTDVARVPCLMASHFQRPSSLIVIHPNRWTGAAFET